MGALTGQSIASSYEQLLHVDTDGGGNTTTLVPVKDGDNGTTFALQLSTTTAVIDNPTASSASQGGILRLQSDDGAVMASGHRLGVIEFGGAEDTSSTITTGARIEAITDATWSASENGADMVFYTTDGNASQSEVLRLTADNKVGVNCDPSVQLEVFANSGASKILCHSNSDDARLELDATSNKDSVIEFKEAGSTAWYIRHKADTANSRLEVFDNDNDNGVYIDQDATSWTSNSDERMKANLVELENATAKLQNLRCVNYNWKHDETKKKRIGLIAQDVYKVYPEAVSGNPDDDYERIKNDDNTYTNKNAMGVNYTELVPALVKSIQELSARVKALE